MKQVLIYSIQPEHVLNFLNGRKTIEIRRRDLPQWAKDKLARGEIVQGYGYCTKGKPILSNYYNSIGGNYTLHSDYSEHFLGNKETQSPYILNGLVVFKFEVSGSDKIYDYHIVNGTVRVSSVYETDNLLQDELLDKACLTLNQISNYVGMNDSYAHHFTNIQPIEPMEIGELYSIKANKNNIVEAKPLKRALQSFGTVYHVGKN